MQPIEFYFGNAWIPPTRVIHFSILIGDGQLKEIKASTGRNADHTTHIFGEAAPQHNGVYCTLHVQTVLLLWKYISCISHPTPCIISVMVSKAPNTPPIFPTSGPD